MKSVFALLCLVALVSVSISSAHAQTGTPGVRFDNPKTMPQPRGYTHVVEVSGPHRTVYISGQLGIDPSGKELTGFNEQATQVFENIKAALAASAGRGKTW